MFNEISNSECTNFLKLFSSYIEQDITPFYISLSNDYNLNKLQVYGITGWTEESVDEDTNRIIPKWKIGEEQNTELELTLRSFLSSFSDSEDALNATYDVVAYIMDLIANETIQAFKDKNYLRALCFATAFKLQFDSVLDSGSEVKNYDLAVYITDTIPSIINNCDE